MSTSTKAESRNPYKRGNYRSAFSFMQRKQVVTRSQVVAFLKEKGLKETAAESTATVLLSPREKDSKRGDCRGNFSAMGHMYFMKPLTKVKGEERKFRLAYRTRPLARRVYNRDAKKVEIRQVKVARATKGSSKKVAKVTA